MIFIVFILISLASLAILSLTALVFTLLPDVLESIEQSKRIVSSWKKKKRIEISAYDKNVEKWFQVAEFEDEKNAATYIESLKDQGRFGYIKVVKE